MTTYYIEENLLSSRVRAFIKDENDEPVFLLVGSWGVKGDCLSINELNGKRLAKVVQTSYSPNPRFDLYKESQKIGSLKRLFSMKRDYYWITSLRWLALGNTSYKHYKISQFNKEICFAGVIRKQGKSYFKIMIADDSDAAVAICVLAILDYWVKKSATLEERSLNKAMLLQPVINKCKHIKE